MIYRGICLSSFRDCFFFLSFLNRLVVSEGLLYFFFVFSLYICWVVRFVFASPLRFLVLNNMAGVISE